MNDKLPFYLSVCGKFTLVKLKKLGHYAVALLCGWWRTLEEVTCPITCAACRGIQPLLDEGHVLEPDPPVCVSVAVLSPHRQELCMRTAFCYTAPA